MERAVNIPRFEEETPPSQKAPFIKSDRLQWRKEIVMNDNFGPSDAKGGGGGMDGKTDRHDTGPQNEFKATKLFPSLLYLVLQLAARYGFK